MGRNIYISQFIRSARCCSHDDDFRYRHKWLYRLVDRLLPQGYIALRLEKSFKKFSLNPENLVVLLAGPVSHTSTQ